MTNLSDIFSRNPLAIQLDEARKQSKRLALHITGIGLKDAIETLDEFETEQKKNIRQKYSRSNQDIFERLHKPIDKVFSARGGSTIINLPDSQLKQYNVFLADIKKGMNLRTWVQNVALDGYHIDPNGLLFLEVDQDGKPYPTYKSTNDIFYYELDGRKVKMVIFTVSAKEAAEYALQSQSSSVILDRLNANKKNNSIKYYRIVDDITDKIVEWDGKEVKEIDALNLPNPFMQCPGFVLSDIFQFNSDLFVSPDSKVVELANSYLAQNSIFEIWKNLHMFPKHWSIASKCATCNGTGKRAGEDCTDCNGTGESKRSSVRDELMISSKFLESQDGKISLPDKFDGYSTPPIEAWQLSIDDLDRLYSQMYFTKWGVMTDTKPMVTVGDKTATQVMNEKDAMIDALCAYSRWAESIETFIIDMTAKLMFPNTYKGCSVHYGDRYTIEGPDVIWEKYKNARTAGASQSILDNLLVDYYEAKYQGAPINLQKALKQMKVEPFVHMTAAQVSVLSITNEDKACKTYFSEWASTLTDMDWIMKNEDALRSELITYVTPKLSTIVEEVASLSESIKQV